MSWFMVVGDQVQGRLLLVLVGLWRDLLRSPKVRERVHLRLATKRGKVSEHNVNSCTRCNASVCAAGDRKHAMVMVEHVVICRNLAWA